MDDQTRDWLLDHHRGAYKFQAERAEKIRDRLAFLVTPFTILGGGILYVLGKYQHGFNVFGCLTFYIPSALSLLAFLAAMGTALYCLGWGFDYLSVPRPRGLQDDVEEISNYAANSAPGLNVLDDVKTTMMERYCEAADYNFAVNFRRTNLALRSTQLGIISFLILLFALPTFFSNGLQNEKPASTVIFYKNVTPQHERRNEKSRKPARARPKTNEPAPGGAGEGRCCPSGQA
jgi:hypothetical protein